MIRHRAALALIGIPAQALAAGDVRAADADSAPTGDVQAAGPGSAQGDVDSAQPPAQAFVRTADAWSADAESARADSAQAVQVVAAEHHVLLLLPPRAGVRSVRFRFRFRRR